MSETELVKNLRDLAALQTKGTHNPFAERKLTFYWKAADTIERLERIEARAKLVIAEWTRSSMVPEPMADQLVAMRDLLEE